jgi:hypothetical protein
VSTGPRAGSGARAYVRADGDWSVVMPVPPA